MTSLLIFGLIICTLLSGYFSASETALFSLSPMQVRAARRSDLKSKRIVARLISSPRGLLVTILMMNVLVNLLVQNFAANLFSGFFGWGLKVGVPLVLTLMFGEVIPKSVALPNNEKIASLVAGPLSITHIILGPLRLVITWITSFVSKGMFFFLKSQKDISHDELGHALGASEKEGILTPDEADLIRGYLNFQKVSVKEVLRPRDEVLLYDISQPISDLTHLFSVKGCSRVPVADGGIEKIFGIVEAKDYFVQKGQDLMNFCSKPLFVPESMGAQALLQKFDEAGEELAIVVDEYGSVAGIVSREDLVEIVVGEISDRRDVKALYTRASKDVIIASGKLEISEFNDLFGCDLESDASLVTIGGWLTEKLGKLPQSGTKYVAESFLFHVLAADPNRVRRVYIRRLQT